MPCLVHLKWWNRFRGVFAMFPEYYREVLDRLQKDIRQDEEREAVLGNELALVQNQLAKKRKAAKASSRILAPLSGQPMTPDDSSEGTTPRHADVAEEVLRESGKPMRVPS